MSRHFAVSLEPSDAFLALLRMKAASEASRWPPQLSQRFRAAVDREFSNVESVIRTLGVCYADLEDRGIAGVDRAAHSRFGDIDAAIHLGACPIHIDVDLDNIKVALERGDRLTRTHMASLATSLRMVLWYAGRTDLLVCVRLQRSGEDLTPDAALRFVDGYLAAAWPGADPPQPSLPSPEPGVERPPSGAILTPSPPASSERLPHQESTEVFRVEALGQLDPELFADPTDLSPSTRATMEMDSLALTTAEIQALGLGRISSPAPPPPPPPQRATTPPTPRQRRPSAPPPPMPRVDPSFIDDPTSLPTLHMKISDVLSEDAQLFLAQTGARWPCEAAELDDAHRTLAERIRRERTDEAVAAQWIDRLSRGYDELRRWTR